MDTRYLTYILTIAEEKNMTKAAKKLYVSQSSLSQYLTKLEQEIGTPLFFRTRGELVLTPAGRLYAEAAKKVIRIKRQLYRDMAGLENRGHITIGVTSQFGLEMLTELIPPFKTCFPNVTVEITESNVPALTRLIKEENIDCAIMALNDTEAFDQEQVDVLRREEVYWAIPRSHPYCAKNPGRPITLEELGENFHNDNILLAKKGSTLRRLADQVTEAAHLTLTTVCETNSIIANRSMVAMGIGVTLIASSCALDKEHVAYYSLIPPITRLNAFVRRKGWVMHEPEMDLRGRILSYFS